MEPINDRDILSMSADHLAGAIGTFQVLACEAEERGDIRAAISLACLAGQITAFLKWTVSTDEAVAMVSAYERHLFDKITALRAGEVPALPELHERVLAYLNTH